MGTRTRYLDTDALAFVMGWLETVQENASIATYDDDGEPAGRIYVSEVRFHYTDEDGEHPYPSELAIRREGINQDGAHRVVVLDPDEETQ